MFKKIFTLSILYIWLLWSTDAFLWDEAGLDLYKDIEDWINELQLKNFEYELSGGWNSISEEVNDILVINGMNKCIEDWITSEDIQKIASWDIWTLYNYAKWDGDCVDWWWDYTIKNINKIQEVIKEIYFTYTQRAEDKSNNIYEISRIWIYSDWDLENSSFDLIHDIEEIDKIIFSEYVPYEWENIWNDDKDFSDFLDWVLQISTKTNNNSESPEWNNNNNNSNTSNNTSWWNNNTTETTIEENNIILTPIETDDNSSYVCLEDNNTSWLSEETLSSLVSNLIDNDTEKAWTNSNQSWETNNTPEWNNTWWSSDNTSNTEEENSFTPYSRVNDNSKWPCNEFFCIKIDMLMYKQDLFWWGLNYSIESFLITSNKHLQKFSSTSLVQSQMTTNNFELWLRDLNLADSFHMWIIVAKKSPPILKVESEENSWQTTEKYKEILRTYYDNAWLNYDKRNSLHVFFDKENELRTISTSAELSIAAAVIRDKQLKEKRARDRKRNELVSKEIDKKILWEDMENFYRRFVELENFTINIYDYTESTLWIVKWMNEIPIK